MRYKDYSALVRQFGGWIEDDIARFPSVWHREQFERAVAGVQS